MRYLLDTSAVVGHPQLLARPDAKTMFVLPVAVLQELSQSSAASAGAQLREVLDAAAQSGVELFDDPLTLPQDRDLPAVRARLSGGELGILRILAARKDQEAITLLSDDLVLLRAAKENGLRAMSVGDFLKSEKLQSANVPYVAKEATADHAPAQVVVEKVAAFRRSQATYFANLLALSGAGVGLTQLGSYYSTEILSFASTVPWWGAAAAALIVGGLLYTFRQRARASYGIVEVSIGVVTAVNAVVNVTTSGASLAAVGLQILGGLYIVVRGLDNIGTGLSQARSPYSQHWKNLFG